MTINEEHGSSERFETHHMIPKHGTYFSDIYHLRNETIFCVKLTQEGHKCQHQILKQVFGDFADQRAANFCGHEKNWQPGQEQMAKSRRRAVKLTAKDGAVTIHPSLLKAAEYLGTSHSAVSHACSGKTKSTMGHKAEYLG